MFQTVSPRLAFNRMFQDSVVLFDCRAAGVAPMPWPEEPSPIAWLDTSRPAQAVVADAVAWAEEEGRWPEPGPTSYGLVFSSMQEPAAFMAAVAEQLSSAGINRIWRVDRAQFHQLYGPILTNPSLTERNFLHFPQEVVEGLFLGSECAVLDEILGAMNITRILSLVDDDTIGRVRERVPERLSDQHLHLSIRDLNDRRGVADLHRVLNDALNFISEALNHHERVLVHCEAGRSRSGSVVVAHVMRTQHLRYHEALAVVKEQRDAVRPNSQFADYLKVLGEEWCST